MAKSRKIKVHIRDLHDDSYTDILIGLLRRSYTHVSAGNAERGVVYTFHEDYNKDELLYRVTVVYRTVDADGEAAGNMEEGESVQLQQMRVKAKSGMPRHLRDARRSCYEHLLLAHMDTSLLVWEQTAQFLKTDPSMQEAAINVVQEGEEEQKPDAE